MLSQNNTIGGYFELELPPPRVDYHRGAIKYQSARSSFLSLLRSLPEVQRVWLPYYICDSMLSPVKAACKEIIFYSLDEQLKPKEQIELAKTDILLYVNYFGVCNQQVRDILKTINPAQVVIDCSQAFYAEPTKCLATIYSPRKFFGIPDGGLLCTSHTVSLPDAKDDCSENRMKHLIQRLAYSPESGYENYKQAENSLQDFEPKRMSSLTEKLLSTVNHTLIKKKRQRNFRYLDENLGSRNKFFLTETGSGPLCYPYMPVAPVCIELLLKKRIFTPSYWLDVLSRVHPHSVEANLTQHLIPIPCDQRYSLKNLKSIIEVINK